MIRSLVIFLLVSASVLSSAPLSLAASGAPQATQPASPAIGNRALSHVVATSSEHRQALVALFRGRRDLPEWVRSIITNARYVTGVSRVVTLPEGAFELFGACDPRDCGNSHIRILFSPDGTKVWARLIDPKEGQQLLGEPSPDQLRALMAPGI
ncbi:Ivy family c-type lysozyme inhibitor [Rhizobium panacihumi]|uniref:Ivy family c-type lysozyme inhibitor n=1 Tax=Rhizobium panacihumi TaxID=2008450 RepID=UPI003D79A29A